MNREELESVIWRYTRGLNSAMTADRYAAMNAILRAADDYATVQCVTAICAPTISAAQARRLAELTAELTEIERRGRYERKAAAA